MDRLSSLFRRLFLTIGRRPRYVDLDVGPVQALLSDAEVRGAATPAASDVDCVLLALARLPLAQRRALELHYWEERSPAEVAAVLGIDERAARGRILRARGALKAIVDAQRRSAAQRANGGRE